jgi:hypothetical protein
MVAMPPMAGADDDRRQREIVSSSRVELWESFTLQGNIGSLLHPTLERGSGLPCVFSGADGNRTHDFLLAKQVRSVRGSPWTSVAVRWCVWPLAPHLAPQRVVENRQADLLRVPMTGGRTSAQRRDSGRVMPSASTARWTIEPGGAIVK